MRVRLRIAALGLAALVAAGAAQAEPTGRYLTLTPFGGYRVFDGEQHFPGTLSIKNNLYVGGRLGWQYLPWLGIEAAGGLTPTAEDADDGRDIDDWHVSGNLMLTPVNGRWGGPFLFAGGGYDKAKVSSGDIDRHYGTVEAGGGLRFWLTDAIGVRFEARSISLMQGDPDIKALYNDVVFGGGIELALGGVPRDTDGDGVPDRKDRCPDTPRGAVVDASGCPIDTDGDKVFDGLDKCPNTPTGCTVDATGCPVDSDGDGVCDGVDQCADTPKGATVDAKGCPSDSDGDSVLDGIDQCADTPKGATVDAAGCPTDADKDGVFDGLDKCPDTPAGARVDAEGCPIELIERETELLDTGMIRLQNINFETAKADLLPDALPTLDIVGQVLTKWPELRIEIGGHTDSRGSNAYNQKLSQARANSVLTYLTGKFTGLKPEQFTVRGYGESKPIAPNTDALGMAKNRRVEFVVLNKDVLKRESERRRLLQKGEAAPSDSTQQQ
jgi:outer membrane protein OmpA-like peptidoglycan-associated protein